MQVHPVVQVFFPDNDAIFQEDDSPKHTVRRIESWFEDHEDSLRHLHWPAQSPPLNITESLWSVLECRVGNRFRPVSSLKELEDVILGEWYSIPLGTIQNLHESIPRRIQAVLQANGGPTPYE
jgi:hypothetical protein